MIENDTICLLRECDAGVQMGISSIKEVLDYSKSEGIRKLLYDCKERHDHLNNEIQQLLEQYQDDGKGPNPIAKGMSWIKTTAMLSIDSSDATIADLMVSGCDMGVKSLSRYLNKYEAADEKSKDIAKRLIQLEEQLSKDLREYL